MSDAMERVDVVEMPPQRLKRSFVVDVEIESDLQAL